MRTRRLIHALGLLALVLAVLPLAAVDRCDDGPGDPCAGGCHLLCGDGCGFSLRAAVDPLGTPEPATRMGALTAPTLLLRSALPEDEPPRG